MQLANAPESPPPHSQEISGAIALRGATAYCWQRGNGRLRLASSVLGRNSLPRPARLLAFSPPRHIGSPRGRSSSSSTSSSTSSNSSSSSNSRSANPLDILSTTLGMRLVVFGDSPSEAANISYCIEHAFDAHRMRLVSIMEKVGQIALLMENTDKFYGALLRPVHNRFFHFTSLLPVYWERNEDVLRELIQPNLVPFTYGILPPQPQAPPHPDLGKSFPAKQGSDKQQDLFSYNSLVQVIIHIDRDWTANGENVRRLLHREGILRYLKQFVPLPRETRVRPQVLVPGAALGRLAFDMALAGYRVEANECSAAMVFAMTSVLERLVARGESRTLFPYLHLPLQDDWDLERKLGQVTFPFLNDSHISIPLGVQGDEVLDHVSVQYGDFVGVYGAQTTGHWQRFDAVVTCFFLDTGRSILEYIEVIKHVLKVGGVWINAGPLHYHNGQAVPYSYQDVLVIVQLLGFEVLQEEKLTMSYCGEEGVSMKPELYNVPIAAFRKREEGWVAPLTGLESSFIVTQMQRPDYVIKR